MGGGGGKIKLLVNANGFLGHYSMITTEGKIGVEIEGNVPKGDWKMRGCVPLPSCFERSPSCQVLEQRQDHLELDVRRFGVYCFDKFMSSTVATVATVSRGMLSTCGILRTTTFFF